MTALVDIFIRAIAGLIGLALGGWSAGRPQSHGSSRWVGWRERKRLGRFTRPEHAAGDGIALGFIGRRLVQSPAEDNVLLFGVQRSGKTSTVVVPTLLTWSGAAIATSTKEELVRLTARHRKGIGPVSFFAPLDRDTSWIERKSPTSLLATPTLSTTKIGTSSSPSPRRKIDLDRG